MTESSEKRGNYGGHRKITDSITIKLIIAFQGAKGREHDTIDFGTKERKGSNAAERKGQNRAREVGISQY